MKGHDNMCMSSRKYTAAKMTGEFIGLFARVFKSALFNILIFFLGFSAGLTYTATKIQIMYDRTCNFESVEKIENLLKQQRAIDNHIDDSIRDLKVKIATDSKK